MDHSQCNEKIFDTALAIQPILRHDCGVCPHGLIRGFEMTMRRDPHTDAMQREIKIRSIDEMTCMAHHPHRALVEAG